VIPEFDVPAHARAAVRSMERRYARYHPADEARATEYRLVDPLDTTPHTSVQGYTDNLMNPCLPSTYAFLAKVVEEVQARYAAAHQRLVLFHVGGDEPPGATWWADSLACRTNPETREQDDAARKDAFYRRLSAIVTARGGNAKMAGWDEVVQKGLSLDGFVSMPWNNVWGEGGEDQAYKEANQGKLVVLAHATNLYMDLAYAKDPDEPGGDWAGFVDERKTFEYLPFDIFANATRDAMGHAIPASAWSHAAHLRRHPERRAPAADALAPLAPLAPLAQSDTDVPNILGLEGLLWGENRKTPELLEYMTFPKILGVAERAWNRRTPGAAALPSAWNEFVQGLGEAELPRLDLYRPVDVRRELGPGRVGVNYRIPPPGASIVEGMLRANDRYPGVTVEISTDGGGSWAAYTAPLPASGDVLVRARTASGRASRAARVHAP
jgi:hexosaminidase